MADRYQSAKNAFYQALFTGKFGHWIKKPEEMDDFHQTSTVPHAALKLDNDTAAFYEDLYDDVDY